MNDDNLHSYILTEPTGNKSTPEANLVRLLLEMADHLLEGTFVIGNMKSPFDWSRPCPSCSDPILSDSDVHSCGKHLRKVMIHGSSWNYQVV